MADIRILGLGVNHVAKTGNPQQTAETTGALAKNNTDPVFDFQKKQNAETAGAIAFGAQDSTAQNTNQFMAMA